MSVFFFLQGCEKDKAVDYCKEGIPDHFNSVVENIYYYAPSFNPQNNNELLFLRQIDGHDDICTYSLLTKQLNIIYSAPNSIAEEPKWGSDGWIMFGNGGRIYHIKSDGTGFFENPFVGYQYDLNVSPTGSEVIGFVLTPNSAINVVDKQGNITTYNDTVRYSMGDWNADSVVASLDYGEVGSSYGPYGVKLLKYPKFEFIKRVKLLNDASFMIAGMDWKPNSNSLIWTTGSALYETDFNTEITKTIKEFSCPFLILFPSVNADGTKVAVSKSTVSVNEASQTYINSSDIYLVDITTGKEEKIVLPK
jgi:hypothetical protein